MSKLKFDHTYTRDQGHKFLKKLERLGFTLSESTVKHPGGKTCRFIHFQSALASERQYLEFVSVKDWKKKTYPPGISLSIQQVRDTSARDVGGSQPLKPRIRAAQALLELKANSRLSGPLANSALEKFESSLNRRGLQTTFLHRNYDWKAGTRERRAGWNFVRFVNSGVRAFFPWITEYEWTPEREKRSRKPVAKHKVGDLRIHGFHFELNLGGQEFFNKLLGKSVDGEHRLPCGSVFYITPGKSNKLRSVILSAGNFESVKKRLGKRVERSSFQGRESLLIQNPDKDGWDVQITARAMGRSQRLKPKVRAV